MSSEASEWWCENGYMASKASEQGCENEDRSSKERKTRLWELRHVKQIFWWIASPSFTRLHKWERSSLLGYRSSRRIECSWDIVGKNLWGEGCCEWWGKAERRVVGGWPGLGDRDNDCTQFFFKSLCFFFSCSCLNQVISILNHLSLVLKAWQIDQHCSTLSNLTVAEWQFPQDVFYVQHLIDKLARDITKIFHFFL